MSLPATQRGYPHIICDPQICGGEPVVQSTRIPVTTLVRAHRLGMDFDEILVQYPQLDPQGLHAALLFYLDHREQIDQLIEESESRPPGAQSISIEV